MSFHSFTQPEISVEITPKKRCGYDNCRKKLSYTQLIAGVCKCGICFCETHRAPDAHTCIDWRQSATEVLSRQLVKVRGDKLERI